MTDSGIATSPHGRLPLREGDLFTRLDQILGQLDPQARALRQIDQAIRQRVYSRSPPAMATPRTDWRMWVICMVDLPA